MAAQWSKLQAGGLPARFLRNRIGFKVSNRGIGDGGGQTPGWGGGRAVPRVASAAPPPAQAQPSGLADKGNTRGAEAEGRAVFPVVRPPAPTDTELSSRRLQKKTKPP